MCFCSAVAQLPLVAPYICGQPGARKLALDAIKDFQVSLNSGVQKYLGQVVTMT